MVRKMSATLVLSVGLVSSASTLHAGGPKPAVNGAGFVPNGWCKGNGNPHAAECPIFAPGSTSPNTYNSHQPVQTTNQLPQPPQQPTLPVIVVTPQTPQTITGYGPVPQGVNAPDITGYSPVIVVTPQPPQVITGFSPGPQQIPPPSFTGQQPYVVPPQPMQVPTAVPQLQPQPQPQAVPFQVPPLKPGYVAYPDYVGPRDPDTGYPVVTANPPQTTTGYAPYLVPTLPPQVPTAVPQAQPKPQPQPVAVPPLVPPLKPGYVAYPDYVGTRDPNTGYPVVTANPPQTFTGYAPNKVPPQPQPQTPTLQTGAIPTTPSANVPTPAQVELPRPRPLPTQGNPPPSGQTTVTITPQGGGSHVGADLITAKSGRQAPTAVPVFEVKGTGERWHCVASGHHIRKVFDDNGNEVYAGSLPGVALQVVPIIRDVPAWHDLSSECLVSVREHPKARAARR